MTASLSNPLMTIGADKKSDILTFFEVSLDLLVIRDLSGIIQRVSPSCSQILGFDPQALCGKYLLDFIHPEDRDYTRACMIEAENRVQGQPTQSINNRYFHRNGSIVCLEWRTHRMGDYVYAIARDVTHKHEAEQALIQAKAAAEAANQAKADFLANISHEIRTPLNGVLGLLEVLSNTSLSPSQSEMVNLAKSSGQSLTRLLSDILDMSMIEAGKMSLENQAFDMGKLLDEVVFTYQTLAQSKGLALTVERAESLKGSFLGDALRLKQVLNNLLSNALKFTPEGQISLRFCLQEGFGEPTIVSIEIEDTGLGFDADQAANLFQRFSQADASITRRFGGSGLGLSISQSIVHMMGGQISARSERGKGSCFSVVLPLPRSAQAPAPTMAGLPLPDRQMSLLVADDHPINQKLIQLLLADLPIHITLADNGQQALEAFKTCRYDLILMDMQMPVMDGLQATQAVRDYEASHPSMSRTPIVMVTANAMEEHRLKSLQAGADLLLAKPFTAQSLRSTLQQLLACPKDDHDLKNGLSSVA